MHEGGLGNFAEAGLEAGAAHEEDFADSGSYTIVGVDVVRTENVGAAEVDLLKAGRRIDSGDGYGIEELSRDVIGFAG